MALQKQKIPVALNTPLDTKSDEFLTPGFASLQNVRHKKTGGIVKRNGYTKLTNVLANTSPNPTFTELLSGSLALKSYKDELVLLSDESIFSYSSHNGASTANSWLSRDYVNKRTTSGSPVVRKDSSALTATVKESTAISTIANYFDPHYLETTDYRIVSADDNTTMTVSISDINTGALIVERQFPIAKSNIATDSTYLYVMGRQLITQDFIYYPIPLTNLNASISAVTIPSLDFTANNITAYDAVSDASQVFVAVASQSASQYSAAVYTLANTTVTNTSTTSLGADYTTVGPLEFRLVKFQSSYVLAYANKHGGSVTTRFIKYNSAGVVTAGPTSIGEVGSYNAIGADANNVYLVYNFNSASTKMATIDASNVVTLSTFSDFPLFPQTNLLINDDRLFVGVRARYTNTGHNVMMQKNLLKTTNAALFGKAQDFVYKPIAIDGSIINSAMTGFPRLAFSSNTLTTVGMEVKEVVADAFVTDPAGIGRKTVTLISYVFDASYESISLNAGMLVAGAITKFYDGASYTELGFLQTPRIGTFTEGIAGLYFPVGTYGMAAVFSWTDSLGNIHRSAPEFKSLVVTTSSDTLNFALYNLLQLTEKENVIIEYYLTETNGSIYYRANLSAATGIGTFILPADTSAEVLYTQSGELENDPPIASLGITYFKNRVFSINKNSLEYSKPVEANYPVEFNANQRINLEITGGDATGVRAMDSNLVIFKKNAIFILNGEGPNALGQQNDYGNPQLITSDTGCEDTNSIVAYPNGLLFKSKKGIYEINRGLAVQYIGAQVAEFNQYEVVSSQLLPEVNEVRFVLSNGSILVYDYQERQWAVDTISNAISGVSHNNVYYYVNSSNIVLGENSLFFDNYASGDALVPYSSKLETNWIQVVATNNGASLSAGVQQWQRLYKIHLLGRYKSAHTLKVSLAYNYNDTVVDFATISPSGSGLYQFVVNPSIQKCEAIKIIIEDTNTSLTNGESMELSSMLLEVGLKGSSQKNTGDGNSVAAT